MSKRYCVEVSLEWITPVFVDADSEAEAMEMAKNNLGDAGDIYTGEARIISIRHLVGEGSI